MSRKPHSSWTQGAREMNRADLAGRPELVWPNKEMLLIAAGEDQYEWVAHDADPADRTPPVLRTVASVQDSEADTVDGVSGHVIAGDALDALNAIGQADSIQLAGGARLIYIDPPFNTGQSFAQYPDSLDRSMWFSMLRDRLVAARELLDPLGSVWVHLDDSEVHHARCIIDEVFGSDAFVATVIWQKRNTRESRSAFSTNHDYIHVYAPSGPRNWKLSRNALPRDDISATNRDNDPRGSWIDAPFTAPGYRSNQQYEITNPAGHPLRPPKGRSWYATEPVYRELVEDNRIWFPKDGAGLPRIKRFVEELLGLVPFSIWGSEDCGTNDDAKRHLMMMFPHLEAFATPKPEALLERIIHIATDPGDLVIDFFAGSGTTAAVAHKMSRRWVSIERSASTVAEYLVPRLHRVVLGADPGGITELTGWRGGGAFDVLEVAHDEGEGHLAKLVLDYLDHPLLPDIHVGMHDVPEGQTDTGGFQMTMFGSQRESSAQGA